MFVSCLYVVLSCVGRGLFDGLITSPEEPYRVSASVWLRNIKGGGQGPIWAVEPLDGVVGTIRRCVAVPTVFILYAGAVDTNIARVCRLAPSAFERVFNTVSQHEVQQTERTDNLVHAE
jgi:hypothetical protein